jgi:3-oxoacyl-[acyl-carrier protein] reductase
LIALPTSQPGAGLLRDKRVVVTAAAGSGIGCASARRCLEEGARVLLSDRHAARLDETCEGLEKEFPGAVHRARCDITKNADITQLFRCAEREMGGFDVLVNNAGLGHSANVVDMSEADWQRVLDITLTGTFRCLRAALRHLREQGSGAIVNVASVTAHRAEKGQAAYAAAKAGVLALSRCAAIEAAEFGVRVNAVVPTITLHPHLTRVASAEYLAEMAALQPQGRAAQPVEIANVIAFLSSDLASYMTGEAISVSGQHA